jgi:hypothetical protein
MVLKWAHAHRAFYFEFFRDKLVLGLSLCNSPNFYFLFKMNPIEILSGVPASSLIHILHGIPLTEYKHIRLTSKFFAAVVEIKIEQLEKECEKKIEKLRQSLIEWAFRKEIPRMQNELPERWMRSAAWHQQIIIFSTFCVLNQCVEIPKDYTKAERLWLKLHYDLPRQKSFFCFYCMKVEYQEAPYILQWEYGHDHPREYGQLSYEDANVNVCYMFGHSSPWLSRDTTPLHAHYVMLHSLHRQCINHWKQWVRDQGRPSALDCKNFCPRCCVWHHDSSKICQDPSIHCHAFCHQCRQWHLDERISSYNVKVSSAEFGLLVNRFHIEPGKDYNFFI